MEKFREFMSSKIEYYVYDDKNGHSIIQPIYFLINEDGNVEFNVETMRKEFEEMVSQLEHLMLIKKK
jgi:uncharacterized radical SAM superfamily Fe-S cluster-containing enzyme